MRSRFGGLAVMLGSATSNQVGAAVGAHAFASVGPAGVVAVRQLVAAAALLLVARPDPRRFTWPQWWPTLLLAGTFAVMNLSLYTAIDRIGLGLAVTLEVLGPLTLALAGSRTRFDLGCAVVAAAGVYVLVLPGPASDFIGIGCALLAAGGVGRVHRAQPGAGGAGAGDPGDRGGHHGLRAGLSAAGCDPCRTGQVRCGRTHLRGLCRGAQLPAVRPGSDRPAPGAGAVLRDVHERPPGAGRPGRDGGARPSVTPERVGGHHHGDRRARAERQAP
jgi:hypothetical protein